MAESYERWLIARGNVFLPSAAAVAKVIEELKKADFIKGDGHAMKTVEIANAKASRESLPAEITAEWLDDPDREEIRLIWPGAGAKYPLTMKPDDTGAADYTFEVHRAPEYVYPKKKNIGALPITCKCGEELDFEWDEEEVVPTFRSATGIFAECDECSRTFDPSKGSAKIKNPFDGSKDEVPGGAAYRFAIKIDCGAHYVSDANNAFDKELVALVEKAFGRQFYEVGSLG